jgi:hypothetical protein
MSGSVRFEWPDFWAYYIRIEDLHIQGDMLKQVKEIYDSVSNEFKVVMLEHAPINVKQVLEVWRSLPTDRPARSQRSLEQIRNDFNSRFSRR